MDIEKLNQFNWIDSFFSELNVKSNNIEIVVIGEEGVKYKLTFIEYIALEYLGHWDESIIESIQIDTNGELVEKALSEVKKNYLDTEIPFCEKHLYDTWKQVNLKITDGSIVKVVCKDVIVEVE